MSKATEGKKIKRIHWNDDDYQRLANYVLDNNINFDELGFIKRLREEYQHAALPSDRRRGFFANRKDIEPLYAALKTESRRRILARAVADRKAQEAAANIAAESFLAANPPVEPSTVTVEATALPHAHEPATEPARDSYAPRTLPVSHTLDLLVETFARQLVGRFMHYLRDELAEAIQGEFLPSIAPAAAKQAGRTIKPRVLIIGLNPQGAGHMIQEFGAALDLRFFEVDQNPAQLKDKSANVDWVIAMRSIVSHAYTDQVKGHKGYRAVNGKLEALREELSRIAHHAEPAK